MAVSLALQVSERSDYSARDSFSLEAVFTGWTNKGKKGIII